MLADGGNLANERRTDTCSRHSDGRARSRARWKNNRPTERRFDFVARIVERRLRRASRRIDRTLVGTSLDVATDWRAGGRAGWLAGWRPRQLARPAQAASQASANHRGGRVERPARGGHRSAPREWPTFCASRPSGAWKRPHWPGGKKGQDARERRLGSSWRSAHARRAPTRTRALEQRRRRRRRTRASSVCKTAKLATTTTTAPPGGQASPKETFAAE